MKHLSVRHGILQFSWTAPRDLYFLLAALGLHRSWGSRGGLRRQTKDSSYTTSLDHLNGQCFGTNLTRFNAKGTYINILAWPLSD
jgi:hypothetical protein